MKLIIKSGIAAVLTSFIALTGQVHAQLQPGWHNAKIDPIAAKAWLSAPSQQQASTPPLSNLQFSSSSTSASASDADKITSEIQALADGLQNDPWRIYEYCRNHIDFEPYWGCKKGATLTYLEGSGNAFDTTALMVSLLKASDVSNVEYRYGLRQLPAFDIQDWFGLASVFDNVDPFPEYPTDQDFTNKFGPPPTHPTFGQLSVKNYRHLIWDIAYMRAQGYPALAPATFGFGYAIGVPHVWIRFTDTDGTVYEMDPSFKLRKHSIADVNTSALSESGYVKNTFLAAAGGTTGTNYVENINEAAINTSLSQYTSAVLNWFKTQNTNNSSDAFIFNKEAEPLVSEGLAANTIDADDFFGTTWLPMTSWSTIPDQWMTKLEITFGRNYNAATDSFSSTVGTPDIMNMAALCGQKFSLRFNGNTVTTALDEATHRTFSLSDSTVDIRFKINHPHGAYDRATGVWTDDGSADQMEGKSYQKNDNFAYTFLYGFDPSGRHLRKRQNVLQDYKEQGLPDDDWRVRTELLNTMGLTWLHQVKLANAITASKNDVLDLRVHSFGRMGQEEGFYVDVGLALSGSFAYDSSDAKGLNTFQTNTVFGSALEHALIEQMQGSDKRATSTVKIMQLANEQGTRVYRATPSNWSSIRSILSGNGYSNGDLDHIASFIINPNSEQESALIPASPTVTLNSWDGTGYATLSTISNGMFISGGFNGGFLSEPDTVDYIELQDYIYSDSGFYDTGGLDLNYAHEAVTTPEVFALDPVDMASGAFVLDKEDLQCGIGMPRGLMFSRHYNSNRNGDQEKGFGYGWTHNLNITATERSSVRSGMGEAAIRQMAPYYTGIQVAADLLDGQDSAKKFQSAMLVAKWATDQLLYKGVSITMGNKTIEFVEMPDGSYEPPAGISMTLTKTATGYSLLERHGNTYTFNSSGNVTTIIDQHGNTATFTYSGGNLTRVTDSYNRRLDFTYNGEKITRVTETAGSLTRAVNIGYTNDVMTSFSDPLGEVYRYEYDADNRMTILRDPENRVVIRNEYDALGRVKHQYSQNDPNKKWSLFFSGYCNVEKNPEGGETCYLFDDRGRSIGIIDQTKNAVTRSYDGEDHIISTTTGKGEVTLYTYDENNNIVTKRDPLGNESTFTYDSLERLRTSVDWRGGTTTFSYTAEHEVSDTTNQLGHISRNTYTSEGLLHVATDPEGRTTTSAYDSFGTLSSVTAHDGTIRSFVNSPRGDILTRTDGEGRVTTNTWNERRQRLTTKAPSIPGKPEEIVTNTYDSSANLASITEGNGNVISYAWNSLGNLISETQPALASGSNTILTTYDSRDWELSTTNSLGHVTQTEYDAARRMTATTDPLSRRSTTAYDSNGQVISRTDALGRSTQITWNARGETVSLTDPLSETTSYAYDESGNETEITNRRGNKYTFTYDAANRLTRMRTPTGKETVSTYFRNDLVKDTTEPSGQKSTYSYNPRNLLSSKSDPTGTITYAYDDSNLLTVVTENAKTITRDFDERARLKSYENEDDDLIQYSYDESGNLTSLIYPDGKEVTYIYNARNLLSSVTDWSGRITSYEYDQIGRLSKITRPNGTVALFGRDAGDQVTSIREELSGRAFSLLRFQFDAAGQTTSRFNAPIAQSSFVQPSFIGTYDDDNRLLTVNGSNVSHDLDGNMTVGPITESSGSINLNYNSRNQLISADGVSYTYDSEGHRKTMTDSSGTTRFTIDPNAPMSRLLVRHRPGGEKTYYVYGLGLLYEVDEEDNTKTYHYDQVGSTIARTDSSGNVIGRAVYSAYGHIAMQSGDMDTPFQYNGQWGIQTDKNGLLNMRARYFSPYLMRFLNADPAGFSGSQNWFSFANGDPISSLDPFGLWSWKSAAWNFAKGVVVGAVVTAAVVVAAPVVATVGAAALVSAGVTAATATTIASATVTGGLAVAAAVGTAATVAKVTVDIHNEDWDGLAFTAGNLVGGLSVGVAGGGRYIANNVGPTPSTVPKSFNPLADNAWKYQSGKGSIVQWLATAPTPQSGGASAAIAGQGAASAFELAAPCD